MMTRDEIEEVFSVAFESVKRSLEETYALFRRIFPWCRRASSASLPA